VHRRCGAARQRALRAPNKKFKKIEPPKKTRQRALRAPKKKIQKSARRNIRRVLEAKREMSEED
jgi:hypothetical protein